MLSTTVEYTDFNGNPRKDTLYFHLSEAEMVEMQYSFPGGMKAYLDKILAEKDELAIMATFKELVLKAYGEKSEDGRRFIKSKTLSEEFAQTEAYSKFFMKLIRDDGAAERFIQNVLPKTDATN